MRAVDCKRAGGTDWEAADVLWGGYRVTVEIDLPTSIDES